MYEHKEQFKFVVLFTLRHKCYCNDSDGSERFFPITTGSVKVERSPPEREFVS